MPRAMLRAGRGLTGDSATVGSRSSVTLTGLAVSALTRSRSATTVGKISAIAWAMSRAFVGSESVTVTSMRTVSGGVVAVILPAERPGRVVNRPPWRSPGRAVWAP